jgi:hypothetical protein
MLLLAQSFPSTATTTVTLSSGSQQIVATTPPSAGQGAVIVIGVIGLGSQTPAPVPSGSMTDAFALPTLASGTTYAVTVTYSLSNQPQQCTTSFTQPLGSFTTN